VRPHSAGFAAAILGPHRRTSRVALLNADLTVAEYITGDDGVVISGSVSIDSTKRRSCQVTLVNEDGEWTPTGPDSPLYLNRLIRVERGVYVDDGPEYVTLGVFLIDRPEVDVRESGSTMSVQGQDRLKLAVKSKFTRPTRYYEGEGLGEVIRAIAQDAGMGATLYRLDDDGKNLAADRMFEIGDDRVDAIRLLSTSYGLEAFVDADGYFVVQPAMRPDTIPDPAFTFVRGETAIMLGVRKGWDDDRLYNHSFVSGESSDLLAPVSAEARDLNPLSPVYNPVDGTGPIGDRVFTYTSAMIRSVDQAQDVADALLLEIALVEETIEIPSVVHPALEAGDVIGVIEPLSRTNDAYLIDTLTIPIGPGSMTTASKQVRELVENQPEVIVVPPVVPPPVPVGTIQQGAASVIGRATATRAQASSTPTDPPSMLPLMAPFQPGEAT
jgi:hypothetical protein